MDGVYPTHAQKGLGCRLWCEGRPYIDYVCGLGTNLFGYANQTITNAAVGALNGGAVLSLSSDLEISFGRKLKELVPFVERMKILKTGTEACISAIKIARAHTKRPMILTEGYHGHADEFVSLTPPAAGCMARKYIDPLAGDFSNLDQNTAAVIVEPIMTDASETRKDWLRSLRAKCTETGTLLIFDEIITGLRVPKNTVSRYWGIEPDIICLGKAIGGGLPLSVVGGKAEVMNQPDYFVSSTFAGDRVALSAGIAAIEMCLTVKTPERLWEQGVKFLTGFNSLLTDVKIEGYPSRGVFKGDELTKALLWQEACLAGLLFGPSWFFNHHHAEYTDMVLNTLSDIAKKIKSGGVKLFGQMPKTPFAQLQRGK